MVFVVEVFMAMLVFVMVLFMMFVFMTMMLFVVSWVLPVMMLITVVLSLMSFVMMSFSRVILIMTLLAPVSQIPGSFCEVGGCRTILFVNWAALPVGLFEGAISSAMTFARNSFSVLDSAFDVFFRPE
jgi:hypothetical protein